MCSVFGDVSAGRVVSSYDSGKVTMLCEESLKYSCYEPIGPLSADVALVCHKVLVEPVMTVWSARWYYSEVYCVPESCVIMASVSTELSDVTW